MAYVQPRSGARGTTYRVMYRVDGKQVSDTFTNRESAAEYATLVDRIGGEAAREVLRARRGSPSGGRVPTVAEAVTDHVRTLSGITEGTRSDYEKIAGIVACSALGPLPVDALTKDAVKKWLAGMKLDGSKRAASAKTKRNRHSLLSAAMSRQVEIGTIGVNPCRGVKIGQSERVEMVTLTPNEAARILDPKILPAHWHPFVITLLGTGLRFGEATALQVRDLDLDGEPPRLTVARAWKHTDGHGTELGPPKTKRGRRQVGLDAAMVRTLRPLVDGRDGKQFVFLNTQGRPIRQHSFHEVWANALTRANKAGVTSKRPRIHDLRHTYASYQVQRGVPINIVQNQLGHESAQTTLDVYGHLAHDALSVAAAASGDFLGQIVPEIESVDPDTDTEQTQIE